MLLPCNLRQRSEQEWNFLNWYIYAAGQSKIPVQYHLWNAMSLLSACVSNKIWFEKTLGERLYANLYVMLIGRSGTGKNRSITRAMKVVEGLGKWEQDAIHLYNGKITPQALFTLLGDKKKRRSNIWIATKELAMSVGSGGKAFDWVTHMAELHEGNATIQDTTRGSGSFKIEDVCVSWTAGSNIPWLVKSIPVEDIKGGFFARICPVYAERNPVRTPRTVYPPDVHTVRTYLTEYLSYLCHLEMQIYEDEHASKLFDWWVQNRPDPTDELMFNYWEQDVRVNQLAMLLALAENFAGYVPDVRPFGTINYWHMLDAINLFEWCSKQFEYLVSFIARGPESEVLDQLIEFFRSRRVSPLNAIVRFASARGIPREKLKTSLSTLIDQKDLVVEQGVNGNERRYVWVGSG